jgi:hypothetical protein
MPLNPLDSSDTPRYQAVTTSLKPVVALLDRVLHIGHEAE